MPDEELPGVNIGNPAGFIGGLLNEGEGPTSGLQIFRDAGGAMNTQAWFRLYGEVADSIARNPLAATLDPYSVPDASDYATWTMGSGGQYLTRVQAFFRDQDTGLAGSRFYLYKSDEPHTPAEAIQAMWDEYGDPENRNEYGQSLQGGIVSNVYVTEPFGG